MSAGHIDLSPISYEDEDFMLFIGMMWKIAEWSPSSRQALLDAGIGTTISKMLRSGRMSSDSSCVIR